MVLLKQNYNTIFGAFFAFLFLFSILVPFHPQNGNASTLFEEGGEDSIAESTEEASTSNIEICDNLVDDDNDGLVDNQDAVDCPITPGVIPTPTPEVEEEAEEEPPTPEVEEEAAPEVEEEEEEEEPPTPEVEEEAAPEVEEEEEL